MGRVEAAMGLDDIQISCRLAMRGLTTLLPGKRLEDSRMEESFEDLIDRDDIKNFVSSSAQCFLHHGSHGRR